jgi:CarD family transcriptional regulator
VTKKTETKITQDKTKKTKVTKTKIIKTKTLLAKSAPPKAPAPTEETKPVEEKPVEQKIERVKIDFDPNEYVVYPAHGVGQIVSIEEQEVAGFKLELFVIDFAQDKMTLRVPTNKVESVGMRKLSSQSLVNDALETLKGKAKVKRTMWSRRAQEYEQKINSGDLISIAEVVRDLYRSERQPEQSYSERQLYEAAVERMGREVAVVEKIDEAAGVKRLEDVLSKASASKAEAEAKAEAKAASAAEAAS